MICVAGIVGIAGEPMKWAFTKAAQTFSMFPGDMTDSEDLDHNEDDWEGTFQGLVDEELAPIIGKKNEPRKTEHREAVALAKE